MAIHGIITKQDKAIGSCIGSGIRSSAVGVRWATGVLSVVDSLVLVSDPLDLITNSHSSPVQDQTSRGNRIPSFGVCHDHMQSKLYTIDEPSVIVDQSGNGAASDKIKIRYCSLLKPGIIHSPNDYHIRHG